MKKKNLELEHLKLVADRLIEAGFEVEEPKEKYTDLLDVWGFTTVKGRKRRVKCFIEIYCTIVFSDYNVYSYWHVNYDNHEESIELTQPKLANHVFNTQELVYAISKIIDPIKKRKAA